MDCGQTKQQNEQVLFRIGALGVDNLFCDPGDGRGGYSRQFSSPTPLVIPAPPSVIVLPDTDDVYLVHTDK